MHEYFKIQAAVTSGTDLDSQLLKIDQILSAINADTTNEEQIGLFESLRADVLFHLKRYDGALDQLRSLYDKNPILRSGYSRRIADVYLKINRQKDAISLLETRLREETDVTFKLNILNWFATNILDPSASITDFQVHIGQTSDELGIKIPENMDAREAVRFLKSELKLAEQRFIELTRSGENKPVEEQIRDIEIYIAQEKVVRFRKFAEQHLLHLEKSE